MKKSASHPLFLTTVPVLGQIPRHIPNLISILRILLVAPLAFCLLSKSYTISLGVFLLAGFSDVLDGYLARRFNWTSRLGALLDPLGDKLLMVTTYLILGLQAVIPMWLVLAVILRDVIIVSGGLLYRFLVGDVVIKPIISSKINMVLQVLLMFSLLLSLSLYSLPQMLLQILTWLVLFSTLISGSCYVYQWGRRAWMSRTGKK